MAEPHCFVAPAPRGSARTLLFCFPPAGGGPSAFRGWPAALPTTVDVRVLALPGRESRFAERPVIDVPAIADAVRTAADRPFAFYGHSLGGLLAFEVIRELRRTGAPLPERCVVGGSRAPHLVDPLADIVLKPDEEFLDVIGALGGVPSEVLANPELMELLLPALRCDFTWYHEYHHTDEEPLPVPITGIAATGDEVTRPELVAGWREHTSAGFRQYTIDGGHFFLQDRLATVTELVAAELEPAAGAVGLVALPGTEWQVWSAGMLRTAGFPADGLALLAAPDCAAVADAHLDGSTDHDTFRAAFDDAARAVGAELVAVAADPLFREAVTWQNPGAMTALDRLVASGVDGRSTSKRREREKIVARYWARYCAKNDSIGFFGPVCWVGVDDGPDAVRGEPGPGLVRRRVVHFEWWALTAFVDGYASDPEIRDWFPLTLQPHHHLRDGVLLRPAHPPLRLSRAEATILSLADGRHPAREVARRAVADESSGLRKESDALLLADQLAEQGLLRWRLDLPYDLTAESFLDSWIAGIGDQEPRVRADFQRLVTARDALAAAAGDADAVRVAVAGLDEEFRSVTAQQPRQRAGETYAGRALSYEDTERDLDLTIGAPVLAALAEPLDLLLRAARWLTVAIARAYADAFRALYQELVGELGTARVPLSELWFLANGLVYGVGERPVDAVMAEFVRRWSDILGLDDLAPGTRRVQLSAAELAQKAARTFPADGPGWSGARLHSPDLNLCAESLDALRTGDFTAVLGELHAAWLTCTSGFFVQFHPDRDALVAAVQRDLGHRTVPLYPTDFPMLTARLADLLVGPADRRLGHAPAPVWEPENVLSVSALTVSDVDGVLVATDDAGRGWPLVELFGEFLGTFAADAYKLVGSAEHTPRVTIDRLVVARETWRTTIGGTGLSDVDDYGKRYLAARRLCRALGLPDRVFVKVGTEVKPCYVDLTSPVSISGFCTMLRTASRESGPDVSVTITELLPTPEQTWVPDAAGRRYYSELRLHVRDPKGAVIP